MGKLSKSSTLFLMLASAAVLSILFVYALIQQTYRLAADDPQIQLAEDTAHALDAGKSFAEVIPTSHVAIETSISPYIVVYTKEGTSVAGNGYLHDVLPQLPSGVFEAQKGGIANENRISWQPEPAIREAIVITSYKNGYVVSGRSLRDTELRIARVGRVSLGALICALIISFVFVRVLSRK